LANFLGVGSSECYNQVTVTVMSDEKMLGKRLKKAREAKGLSQVGLAKALSVTSATINRYEQGIRQPDPGTLHALADELEVSVDWLLGRTDDPKGHCAQVTTIAAHRADDPLAELPEEARRSVEDFIEYAKRKYGKKEEK